MSSDATLIREAIISRLSTLPGYVGSIRRQPVPQIQPADLPQLSVVIKSERLSPDGDANAGDLRFIGDITITISDVRGFAKQPELDAAQDDALDAIETTLFNDGTFTKMGPEALFEAVTSISRTRNFPQQGEAYFAELRLEVTFEKRVEFPAIVTDALRHVVVTAPPNNQLKIELDGP